MTRTGLWMAVGIGAMLIMPLAVSGLAFYDLAVAQPPDLSIGGPLVITPTSVAAPSATPDPGAAGLELQAAKADQAGLETLDTPVSPFFYEDNRFEWQVLDQPPVHLHWHHGDVQFGQSALDIAAAALARAGRDLNAPLPERLDIYVYSQAEVLQGGLGQAGRVRVGGHAYPELGVVLVSAAPGLEARLELAREIPHELTHLLLYQITGVGYASLPNWLKEGVASLYEEVPPPEYALALTEAADSGGLLPFQALCARFPVESGEALLASAQSDSLARYIRTRSGPAGLQRLIGAYGGGMGCLSGVESALGMSLEELEHGWRQEVIGRRPVRTVLSALGGYAALSAILVLGPLAAALAVRRGRGQSADSRLSPDD